MLAMSMFASCATATNTSDGGKIGFIFVGAGDDLGYNQAAMEGSNAVARAFPDQYVIRTENVPETAESERAMEDLIDQGARIIFATSYGHLKFAVNVARRHPNVVFLHQGGIEPKPNLPNLGAYWGTVYEPVYLAGIAAGRATKTNKIGYVVAFPIPATFNNVNALQLGARSVNPNVTTRVISTNSWCDTSKQEAAVAALLAQGVDILTAHQDCNRVMLEAAEKAGVMAIGYHYDASETAPKSWLIGSAWNWDPLFVDIVRTILDGHFRGSKYDSNWLGGLQTKNNPFVLTEFTEWVSKDTRDLIGVERERFASGGSPFTGPITDRDGKVQIPAGVTPTNSDTLQMNYFVEGVIGDVPSS